MVSHEADVRALADAVWQCLDDMGQHGRSVCGYAKAQLRAAYEPFFEDKDDRVYGDWMTLAEAQAIMAEVEGKP